MSENQIRRQMGVILEGGELSAIEAQELLHSLLTEEGTDLHIVALMAALRMRSVSVAELEGFRAALLGLCVMLDLDAENAVDLCGTGGDQKNTFNISTVAALTVAACGGRVVKHGNYGFSSACGSSNVLEACGLKLTSDAQVLRRMLEESGICFLHAPLFHPALKRASLLRKQFGHRSFFNLLGPLVNPARPGAHLIGVGSLEIQRLYAYVLERTTVRFAVVHALDGYDEVSLTGAVRVWGRDCDRQLLPEDFGGRRLRQEELAGGTSIEENARLFRQALAGKGTPGQTAVIAANAGLALQLLTPDRSLTDAVGEAQEALSDGRVQAVFERAANISRGE